MAYPSWLPDLVFANSPKQTIYKLLKYISEIFLGAGKPIIYSCAATSDTPKVGCIPADAKQPNRVCFCNTDNCNGYEPIVNYTNNLCACFLYESALHSFSLVTVWLCDFLVKGYQQKMRVKNVDEIDPIQFHPHFMRSFSEDILFS